MFVIHATAPPFGLQETETMSAKMVKGIFSVLMLLVGCAERDEPIRYNADASSVFSVSFPRVSVEQATRLIRGRWRLCDFLPSPERGARFAHLFSNFEFRSDGSFQRVFDNGLQVEGRYKITEGENHSLLLILDGMPHGDFRIGERYFMYDQRPIDGAAELYRRIP